MMSSQKHKPDKEFEMKRHLIQRVLAWADKIRVWSGPTMYEFLNAVYGNQTSTAVEDPYYEEKVKTIQNNGVPYWIAKLDGRNKDRLYTLILEQSPSEWWLSLDKKEN